MAGHLKIKLKPHPIFQVKGSDLEVVVPVAPWEAALGHKIEVPTMDGKAALKLPHGIIGEQTLRLRGKGLTKRKGKRGDLYAIVRVAVPKSLSTQEKELFQKLADTSSFKPREDK